MQLGDLITRGHIVERLKARTKEEAIAELVDVLVKSGDVPPDQREEILVALLKREALATTGLGMGIAVPHATVKSVKGFLGALGFSRGGVPFTETRPAYVIFLFLSPESDPAEHLQLMALVSRLASDPAYVRLLQSAQSRPSITRIIRQAEHRLFPDEEHGF